MKIEWKEASDGAMEAYSAPDGEKLATVYPRGGLWRASVGDLVGRGFYPHKSTAMTAVETYLAKDGVNIDGPHVITDNHER